MYPVFLLLVTAATCPDDLLSVICSKMFQTPVINDNSLLWKQKHKNREKKFFTYPVLAKVKTNMYLKAKKCRNEKRTKPNLLGALRIRNKRVER